MSSITDKLKARIAELEILLDKSRSESLQSAQKLKNIEEFNFALFQYSPVETVVVDRDGRVLKSNLAKRQSADKLPELGDRMYLDYAANHEIDMRTYLMEAINKGKLKKFPELKYRKEYLSVTIAPFSGGAIITNENITRRKEHELERIKLAKLESVGTLAGGIAHDFNNVLTSILGNISLSKLEAPAESELENFLEESEKACFRARSLTNRLLTFSQGGAPVKRKTKIDRQIIDTASFALRGSAASIEYDIDTNLWPVNVDEGQINQVIDNMVVNAAQAISDSGKIKISAENMPGRNDDKKKFVKIVIEDNGHGIKREYLAKIFDPYFSTKSNASGLGLATSHSVISNHEGSIAVISEEGQGTSFQILLPAAEQLEGNEENPDNSSARTGDAIKLKILVMDDEKMVQDISSRMLEKLGHRFELAGDGEEAIEKYMKASRSGEPFDIVIMDLTVKGGMGGSATLERLLELDPNVKAIVSSGYSNAPVMSDYRKYGFRGIVTKPYRMDELSSMLDSVYAEDQ